MLTGQEALLESFQARLGSRRAEAGGGGACLCEPGLVAQGVAPAACSPRCLRVYLFLEWVPGLVGLKASCWE